MEGSKVQKRGSNHSCEKILRQSKTQMLSGHLTSLPTGLQCSSVVWKYPK